METAQYEGNPMGHGESDDYSRYLIDQKWKSYTKEEHETWGILHRRQSEILKERACPEFLSCMKDLAIHDGEIPDFGDLNKRLKSLSGWEVVAVPGLIPNRPFFKLLSERKFPAGTFIRKRSQLDYIEEPDVFHDAYGHVPLLAHPVFADYLQAYGRGGLRAHDFGTIDNLARLYWYTVEFGLIGTPQGLKIYGSGILSSPGESVFSLEDDSPHRLGFDLRRVMRTTYRVDDYQQLYFVIDSFQQLFDETYQDFAALYRELSQNSRQYTPLDLLPGDKVVTKGTQTRT